MKDFALLSLKINIKNQFKQYQSHPDFNIEYQKGIDYKNPLNSNNIVIQKQFSIENKITSKCYIDIELGFFYEKKPCILHKEIDIHFDLKHNNNIDDNTLNKNIEENEEEIGFNLKKRKAIVYPQLNVRDNKRMHFQENIQENFEYNFKNFIKFNFNYEITDNNCQLHSIYIILDVNHIKRQINKQVQKFLMDNDDEDAIGFIYRMSKLGIQD